MKCRKCDSVVDSKSGEPHIEALPSTAEYKVRLYQCPECGRCYVKERAPNGETAVNIWELNEWMMMCEDWDD